ncbi:hypothetical protein FUSNEC_GEN_129_03545 [Fusobacterium necrophorum subsp. funduliforme]|nr:hypothetical protein A2U07_03435 [Fusobacterium necrophorum subsp. funduliforme]
MFFEIKHCMYLAKYLDEEEKLNSTYMGNAYYLTDYMFKESPKFGNELLKKEDFIRRWKNVKAFLDVILPSIKDNISWNYIKKLKVEEYKITFLTIYVPVLEKERL